jgi:hypothetical protein
VTAAEHQAISLLEWLMLTLQLGNEIALATSFKNIQPLSGEDNLRDQNLFSQCSWMSCP